MEERQELLPVGQSIIHLGRELNLKKIIGEGFTGEVYEGALEQTGGFQKVAVKAMKPLDIRGARERFQQEGTTLASLMELEARHNSGLLKGIKIAPEYYGMASHEGVEYFVMEFIEGETLPELLRTKRTLPERQALTACLHLFHLLDLLHRELDFSFVDLKFENLWWVPGVDGRIGHLKVTDFGTLKAIDRVERANQDVDHDLLLAAVISFKLFTGRAVSYSLRGLQESVSPLIERYQDQMSWGVQRFFSKALHRNPQRRYQTAREFVDDLSLMVDFWEEESDENLLEDAQIMLEEALKQDDLQGDRAQEMALRAKFALSVLEKKNPNLSPRRLDEAFRGAEDVLSKADYINTGTSLFEGGMWRDAFKVFSEGKDWYFDPSQARRWAYLAQAMMGDEISSENIDQVKQDAKKAIELMGEGQYDSALERWQILAPQINLEGIKPLIADCKLFRQLEDAQEAERRGDYDQALDHYQNAFSALQDLPDRDFVLEMEGVVDPQRMTEEMRRLQQSRGKAAELITEWKQAPGSEKVIHSVEKFNKVLRLYPAQEGLADCFEEAIQLALEENDLKTALELIDLSLAEPRIYDKLKGYSQVVPVLHQAITTRSIETRLNKIKTAISYKDLSGVQKVIQGVLDEISIHDELPENINALDTLAQIYRKEFSDPRKANRAEEKAQSLRVESQNQLENAVDAKIARATLLMHPEGKNTGVDLWKNTNILEIEKFFHQRQQSLKKARILLEQAMRITRRDHYREEEISQSLEELDKLQEEKDQASDQVTQKLEGDLVEKKRKIKHRWSDVKQLQDWTETSDQYSISQKAAAALSADVFRRVKEIYYSAYHYLSRCDGEDQEIKEILAQTRIALDKFGVTGWKQIAQDAEENAANIQEEVELIQDQFHAGKLEESMANLHQLEENYPHFQELDNLQDKMRITRGFVEWVEQQQELFIEDKYDPAVVNSIHQYLLKGIPEAYWEGSRVPAYVESMRKKMDGAIRRSILGRPENWQQDNFIQQIKRMVEIERIAGLWQDQQLGKTEGK